MIDPLAATYNISNMMRFLIIKVIAALCLVTSASLIPQSCAKTENGDNKRMLEALDKTIAERDIYERLKRERIDSIKAETRPDAGDSLKYEIYDRLFDEYYQYDIDSAIFYARKKLSIAQKSESGLHRNERIIDAEMDIADRYVLSGMYLEASDIMNGMEPEFMPRQLMLRYFQISNNLYGNMARMSDDPLIKEEYIKKRDSFRNELYRNLSDDDLFKLYVWSDIEIDKGNPQPILDSLLAVRSSGILDVHERAIVSYIASIASRMCGRDSEAIGLLAESAANDLRTPVNEYKSLYELAELLYREGDIKRAYRYVNQSIRDAVAANASINVQAINSMLPLISETYDIWVHNRRTQLYIILFVISALLLSLVIAVQYMIRSHRKVAVANARLKEYVNLLQESNDIKEQYLGIYLDMCSDYIAGLERYRSKLRRAAKDGGFGEVMENLKSTEFIDKELEGFYVRFDESFLALFPDFVERLNSLLQEDKRFEARGKNGMLTTELRVAALIRLGVTDSTKIAHFLRRSVSTIYNYRVKMRNSAVSGREDFEKQIMSIGRLS